MEKTVRLAGALFLGCVILCGQVASVSQLRGSIQDSSGAAIPGTEVKVAQTATGAVRTVTSDAAGNYVLPQLPIGPYQLTVTKDGFSRYVQTGIRPPGRCEPDD